MSDTRHPPGYVPLTIHQLVSQNNRQGARGRDLDDRLSFYTGDFDSSRGNGGERRGRSNGGQGQNGRSGRNGPHRGDSRSDNRGNEPRGGDNRSGGRRSRRSRGGRGGYGDEGREFQRGRGGEEREDVGNEAVPAPKVREAGPTEQHFDDDDQGFIDE